MSELIALFSPSLRGGGAERVMLNLAREFSKRQISVDIVLSRAEGQYLAEVPSDVRVIDLDSDGVLASLPGLVRYLFKEKPYAFLSTQIHANVIALFAKRLSCSSTRVVVREANVLSLPSSKKLSWRVRIMLFLARFSYPWANGVISVSYGVANDLSRSIGLQRDRINVIYNPVVRPELYASAQAELNHPWFVANEPPVILSVGRLTEQKDFTTLIQAFSLVRKQIPARLVILGEGEMRLELEAQIRELGLDQDVSLLGFEKNPYAYMARAAIYVLSSVWEGLPNTLIEAMAIGIPVVATDCDSGPREILADGKYGRLVPVGDTNAIAEGILDVLLKRAYPIPDKEALKEFNLETCADKYLQMLQSERDF